MWESANVEAVLALTISSARFHITSSFFSRTRRDEREKSVGLFFALLFDIQPFFSSACSCCGYRSAATTTRQLNLRGQARAHFPRNTSFSTKNYIFKILSRRPPLVAYPPVFASARTSTASSSMHTLVSRDPSRATGTGRLENYHVRVHGRPSRQAGWLADTRFLLCLFFSAPISSCSPLRPFLNRFVRIFLFSELLFSSKND